MVTVPLQLSPVEVAVPVLLGAVDSPQASTLSAGHWMAGGVVSAKLMCCTQLLVFLQASDAYQVRSIPALPVQLAATGVAKARYSFWLARKLPPITCPCAPLVFQSWLSMGNGIVAANTKYGPTPAPLGDPKAEPTTDAQLAASVLLPHHGWLIRTVELAFHDV